MNRRSFVARSLGIGVGLGIAGRPRPARADDGPLAAGDHERSLTHGALERTCRIHVPPGLEADRPTPLVLALHPLATNAAIMVRLCGLNATADRDGFVVAYPDGTGRGTFRSWNAGGVGLPGVDDVGFLLRLLDELVTLRPIDSARVYATGMSNGGMMCHRLAAEAADRFAAVAPVSGTLAVARVEPKRPVSIVHFHGTADTIVPFDGPGPGTPRFVRFESVPETIRRWVVADGCPAVPVVEDIATRPGDLAAKRSTYGPGRDGSEVVLYAIEGGGHTWPGGSTRGRFLGASARLAANDLISDFFRKHARTE